MTNPKNVIFCNLIPSRARPHGQSGLDKPALQEAYCCFDPSVSRRLSPTAYGAARAASIESSDAFTPLGRAVGTKVILRQGSAAVIGGKDRLQRAHRHLAPSLGQRHRGAVQSVARLGHSPKLKLNATLPSLTGVVGRRKGRLALSLGLAVA